MYLGIHDSFPDSASRIGCNPSVLSLHTCIGSDVSHVFIDSFAYAYATIDANIVDRGVGGPFIAGDDSSAEPV
jgi:hypothetical protein